MRLLAFRNSSLVTLIVLVSLLILPSCQTTNSPKTTPPQESSQFTTEEEWYYKLLCAITDPKLQHVKVGTFSFAPTNPIYSAFKNLVRYGGLTTNYIDCHSPPSPLDMITRHESADGVITGQSSLSSFWYVNKSDVDAIVRARDKWYQRLYWLHNTRPIRLYAENVAPSGNAIVDIPVGTNGSLITSVFQSGYQTNLRFKRNGEFHTMHVSTWHTSVVWENRPHSLLNYRLMAPLAAKVDGENHTYYVHYYASTVTGLASYVLLEKYDLPAWW